MDKEQGLQIIEQALNLANTKGAFKLEESATILVALNVVKNSLQESPKIEESPKVKIK